jgi:hypothetical protein
MDWLGDNWTTLTGLGVLGGGLASGRRVWRSIWGFLADAAMAPYYRAENTALRDALDRKTHDYDELLIDYQRLKRRRDEDRA